MKKLHSIGIMFALAWGIVGCGGSSNTNSSNAVVDSNYAYISDGNLFKIVDITDPSDPVSKGNLAMGSAHYLTVTDKYVYVSEYASSDPYVNIINVDDKAAPVVVSPITKSNPFALMSDMYIDDSTAYVTDEYKGLHVLDISNGGFQPQALTGADAMSVTLLNGKMFMMEQGSEYGIAKYDISTPTSPVRLAKVENTNILDVNTGLPDVTVASNFLVDAFSYPHYELDQSGTPVYLDNSHHSWIENDGTHLYSANVRHKNLVKFDDTLTHIASVDTGGFVTALAIDGDYAYLSMHNMSAPLINGFDGVKMIDLSTMTVQASVALSNASGVAVQDNRLYVTDDTGLHIYDTSNASLTHVASLTDGSGNFIALGK